MLVFEEKIRIFTSALNQEELSYADSFNADINICGLNCNHSFLLKLESEENIINWINVLKSKIVMNEDEAELLDIVDDYILNS
jgi:hypothetical protein